MISEPDDVGSDTLTDSRDRTVEPGDAVWVGDVFTRSWAVFAGNNHIIKCEKKKQWVSKEDLTEDQPFGKLIVSGQSEEQTPRDRLEEAERWVGRRFKGNWMFVDFLAWIYSRKRYLMAVVSGLDLHVEEEAQQHNIAANPNDTNIIGRIFEAKDKQTGLWYKVEVTEQKNEVRVSSMDKQRLPRGFIPVSDLRPDSPQNDSSVVGRIYEAQDSQTKKWSPVIVTEYRKNQVRILWMTSKKESNGFIPLSRLRPHVPKNVSSFVGMSCEAWNKLTGKWCPVMVTQHTNKVEVHWLTLNKESDEFISVSSLRQHLPKFRKEEKVMARFRPPHPTLSEAAVLNCEGGFVQLEYENGRRKTIPEQYAFVF